MDCESFKVQNNPSFLPIMSDTTKKKKIGRYGGSSPADQKMNIVTSIRSMKIEPSAEKLKLIDGNKIGRAHV